MVDQYVPGTCNIGPAEVARRRRVGHLGLALTALLAVILLALGAARPWHLLLALPATMAAAGYLQARLRFCFDYGFRGVHNFDALGHQQRVAAEAARAADRRRALAVALASLAVGLAVALLATLP
ncbi:MAG TPA: hypothetical protein VGM21_06795 [Actinomycetota bacterium]|jgi:hypothetical protein